MEKKRRMTWQGEMAFLAFLFMLAILMMRFG